MFKMTAEGIACADISQYEILSGIVYFSYDKGDAFQGSLTIPILEVSPNPGFQSLNFTYTPKNPITGRTSTVFNVSKISENELLVVGITTNAFQWVIKGEWIAKAIKELNRICIALPGVSRSAVTMSSWEQTIRAQRLLESFLLIAKGVLRADIDSHPTFGLEKIIIILQSELDYHQHRIDLDELEKSSVAGRVAP